MKTCADCRIEKRAAEFYRDRSKKSGRSTYCKDCTRERARGPAARAAQQKYRANDDVKERIRAYDSSSVVLARKRGRRKTPEGRAKARAYWSRPEVQKKAAAYRKTAPWKESCRRANAARADRRRFLGRVHRQVSRAIERGDLERPTCCPVCLRRTKVEAHHRDYDKPLDVVWCCRRCHKKEHWLDAPAESS